MTLEQGAGASHAPALRSHSIGSFEPELGGSLRDVTLAFETWGQLDAAAESAKMAGARAHYAQIDTLSGHDAFLKDWKELTEAIQPFLDKT